VDDILSMAALAAVSYEKQIAALRFSDEKYSSCVAENDDHDSQSREIEFSSLGSGHFMLEVKWLALGF
jgi:hypothetical protein